MNRDHPPAHRVSPTHHPFRGAFDGLRDLNPIQHLGGEGDGFVHHGPARFGDRGLFCHLLFHPMNELLHDPLQRRAARRNELPAPNQRGHRRANTRGGFGLKVEFIAIEHTDGV